MLPRLPGTSEARLQAEKSALIQKDAKEKKDDKKSNRLLIWVLGGVVALLLLAGAGAGAAIGLQGGSDSGPSPPAAPPPMAPTGMRYEQHASFVAVVNGTTFNAEAYRREVAQLLNVSVADVTLTYNSTDTPV